MEPFSWLSPKGTQLQLFDLEGYVESMGSTKCALFQEKTSTCHHTLKGYVLSMPKARTPIVFFLSRSVHNTSLRLLQFINLRYMYYSFSETQGQILRVMYVYFTPTEEDKRKCSTIRLQLWCRWIFPLFTLLNFSRWSQLELQSLSHPLTSGQEL